MFATDGNIASHAVIEPIPYVPPAPVTPYPIYQVVSDPVVNNVRYTLSFETNGGEAIEPLTAPRTP